MSSVRQPKRRGTVIFTKIDAETKMGYGFIQPAGSDGEREKNIWFGNRAISRAKDIKLGDEVKYVLNEKVVSGTCAKFV